MPLTDQNNKPIPMNGEHPAHDFFGTTIDYKDAYYVMEDENIVHPLSIHKYLIDVMNCEFATRDDWFPKIDIFDTIIHMGDTYYILPDETIIDSINTDEYFVHVLKAELVKTGE